MDTCDYLNEKNTRVIQIFKFINVNKNLYG
jgi:hypothetical protein